MNVTAIIPHYWDSRIDNLQAIVDALRIGDVAPQQIIIWNNTPQQLAVWGADIIDAGKNWGIAARFAAAYLARTEFVLFQDNDVLVQPETLRNMMHYPPDEGIAVDLQGRMLGSLEAPYSTSEYVTNVNRVADIGLSRISLMRRSTAMYLATVIPPDVTDDDIWTSFHSVIRLVTYGEDQGFTNLPETEGLSADAVPHVLRRDKLVQKLWADQMRISTDQMRIPA